MNLRARALDQLEALLDEPHAVQDARIAELALQDATLADEVRRLIAADREDAPESELTERVRRAAQDFDLPDKLGPYVIIREIGRGGMGVVYEAEQLRPIRRVALKTLPVLGVTPDARRRFDMEVQALARVLHPGIPQVYEVFEHDGRPILAMELVQGRRLDQALEEVPTRARAKVLQQLAEAVAAAHAAGVVHRDLKPANILVGADGQPKVLDFGIAALEGSEDLAEGTPRYMAPEQRAGLPQDTRVDVYALGVLAGELLGEDRQRRDDLDRLLARATAEDPAARLDSARVFAEELHRWRTWRPLRSVPTSTPRRVALLARRAPLAVALASVLALLVLAMLAAAGWQGVTWWDARRLAVLERQATEQAAARRLMALQQWAEAAGPEAPALRDTFRRLVDDPTLDGAAALSDAWTWWADQEPDARRVPEALAQAWVRATSEEQERRTRAALARQAWRHGRWAALARLAPGVEAQLPDEAAAAAMILLGNHQRLRELLPESARPLTTLLEDAHWEDREWASRAVLGPHWIRVEPGRLHVTDALGAVSATLSIPRGGTRIQQDGEEALVHVDGQLARFRPGAAPDSLEFVPGSRPPQATIGTVRGESLSLRLTERGLIGTRTTDGAERVHIPRDRIGRGYIERPVLLDLDGDGSDEALLAAFGWHDTGLQVWDLTASPPRLLHHRAEVAYRLAALSTDPPRLVVAEAPPGTTPRPFRPHLPRPLRTVRVLRWTGETWLPEADLYRGVGMMDLDLGDLDGDGVKDLIVSAQGRTALLRAEGAGRFSQPLVLPGLRYPRLGQADQDPALELWLAGEHTPSLLLGVDGAPPLAALPSPDVLDTEPVPDGASSAVRRRWERIEELARIGFTREAVRALEPLGQEPAPVGIAALRWSLILSEDRPATQRRLAQALDVHPGASAEDHRLAEHTLRRAVHELPDRGEQSWSGPRWPLEVLRREAVRTHLDGTLDLILDADTDAVWRLPVRATGGPVRLDADVELNAVDFGAGVELSLHVADRTAVLELQRVGGGPPEDHRLAVRCGSSGRLDQHILELPENRLRLTLSWDPEQRSVVCRGGPLWMRRSVDLGQPQEVRFALQALPTASSPLARLDLRLDRMSLSGADPLVELPFDASEPARTETLTRLTRSEDPGAAAVGWGRLGRPERAPLASMSVTDLAHRLRDNHELWLEPVRSRRPEVWAAALHAAMIDPDRVGDPLVARVLRRDLLARLDPRDEHELALLVMGARALHERGHGIEALRLLERIPDGVASPRSWQLRALLYQEAGDAPAAADAQARSRAGRASSEPR